MALNVGTLTAFLHLNNSGFTGPMAQSTAAANNARAQLAGMTQTAGGTSTALTGVGQAQTSTTASTGQMASASHALIGTLTKLAAAAGLTAVGFKAFKFAQDAIVGFNSKLEQTRIAFTTMLGSAQKADAFIADMKDFAKRTPFDFAGLVGASQRLLAMGIAAKDVKPYLTAIGDAVAGLGGGRAEVDRMVLALGQMSTAGKVNAQDLRQMTELGVPAIKILAESFGVTVAQMRDMVTAGKVLSTDAIPKLIDGIENGTAATAAFGGMMDKQADTWQGALSTIGDSLTMTLANIGLPLFKQMSAGAQGLAADLSSPGFQRFADVMGDSIGYGIGLAVDVSGDFLAVVGQIVSAFGALQPLAIGVGAGFLGIGESVRWVTGLMGAHATEVAAVVVAVGGAVLAYQGMKAAEAAITAVRWVWMALTQTMASGSIGTAIASAVSSMNLMKLASAGVGLALAAGLIWWQKHKQAVQEAERQVDAYTDALKADNGAIGENTRVLAANQLQKAGAFEAGKKLGLSSKIITDAALGEADAIKAVTDAGKRLNDQIDTGTKASNNGWTTTTRTLTAAQQDQADALKSLEGILGKNSGQLTEAQAKNKELTAAVDDGTDSIDGNTDAVDDNRKAQELVANALGTTSAEMKDQKQLSDVLKSSLDALTGTAMSLEDAQSNFLGSLRAIGDTVKDNNKKLAEHSDALDDVSTSLDINTETGGRNRKNIRESIKATNDMAQAQIDAGGTAESVASQYQLNIDKIQETGKKAGFTKKDIDDMIAAMSADVPTLTLTIMAANLGTTVDQLKEVERVMGRLDGRSITTYTESVSKFTTQDQANAFLASPYAMPETKASGGPVKAGMLYKVNELGVEFFRPNSDGHITSASNTRAMSGNQGNADVVAAIAAQTAAINANTATVAQMQARAYTDAADQSRLSAMAGSGTVNR